MLIEIKQEIPDEYLETIMAGFKEEWPKEDDGVSDMEHIISVMKDEFKNRIKKGLIKIAQRQAAASVVLPDF